MAPRTLTTNDLERGVHSVILYGSNARGEATARSDVDLLVIVAEESEVAAAFAGQGNWIADLAVRSLA